MEENIYRFYDHGTSIIGIIRTDCPKKQLEELLKEYKESDDAYNWEDWIDFLKRQGFMVQCLTPEYEIYF